MNHALGYCLSVLYFSKVSAKNCIFYKSISINCIPNKENGRTKSCQLLKMKYILSPCNGTLYSQLKSNSLPIPPKNNITYFYIWWVTLKFSFALITICNLYFNLCVSISGMLLLLYSLTASFVKFLMQLSSLFHFKLIFPTVLFSLIQKLYLWKSIVFYPIVSTILLSGIECFALSFPFISNGMHMLHILNYIIWLFLPYRHQYTKIYSLCSLLCLSSLLPHTLMFVIYMNSSYASLVLVLKI